jgi:hypothetical protein
MKKREGLQNKKTENYDLESFESDGENGSSKKKMRRNNVAIVIDSGDEFNNLEDDYNGTPKE